MGKKAVKSGGVAREGPSSKTDDEIIKDRRRHESYAVGDSALFMFSWALWALATFWFLIFASATRTGEEEDTSSFVGLTARCFDDPALLLAVCGVFCSGLSKSSLKASPAAWSWWRKPWQLGWAVSFALFALAFCHMGFTAAPRNALSLGKQIGFVCGLGSVAMVLTLPQGPRDHAVGSSAPLGKLHLMVVASICFALVADVACTTSWNASVTATYGLVRAAPLFMLGGGMWCASTEGELITAMCSVLLLCLGAIYRALVVFGSTMALAVPVLVLVPALALFLPFPAKEPDTNLFYAALMRSLRRFQKTLSQPVGGFGDSSEG